MQKILQEFKKLNIPSYYNILSNKNLHKFASKKVSPKFNTQDNIADNVNIIDLNLNNDQSYENKILSKLLTPEENTDKNIQD